MSCAAGEELGRFRVDKAKGGGGDKKKGRMAKRGAYALADRHVLWSTAGGEGAGGSLRIRPDGGVDMKGGAGVWARFLIEGKPGAQDGAVLLVNVGHTLREERNVYLSWSPARGFGAAREPSGECEFVLKLGEHANTPFGTPSFFASAAGPADRRGSGDAVTIEECLHGGGGGGGDGWTVVDAPRALCAAGRHDGGPAADFQV